MNQPYDVAVVGILVLAVAGGLGALWALVRSQAAAMDRLVDSNKSLLEAFIAIKYPVAAELMAQARAAEDAGPQAPDEDERYRI